MLLMTLPSPRHAFYQSPNYEEIQFKVLTHSNEIVKALGLYSVRAKLELLAQMQAFQY